MSRRGLVFPVKRQTKKEADSERSPKIPVFELFIYIVCFFDLHNEKKLGLDHVEFSSLSE